MKPSEKEEEEEERSENKKAKPFIGAFAEQLHQLFTLIYQIVSIDSETWVAVPFLPVEFNQQARAGEKESARAREGWVYRPISCKIRIFDTKFK